ncbi:GIY-YIG nuclease family protein [Plantactinospora sp. KLBMP9567]|uniref:GIY-YIG nuclease family protein n=1 Tax=Plantactinospora sp. KLBMP9567 TaxID=3085900 RepID=UPI002981318E|nr:GIY-YIG nuclease family protein [Plantactinospora sp. KLBMP9567]MDW5328677.1 GIY-YIG nuclease family protein [Plantactinospora sp. KLBMP9567]
MPDAKHHDEFKLSITKALADQLSAALQKLTPKSLTGEALDALPKGPGIYQLYVDDQRVYVGKASKSLPARLRKHHKKLSGRPIAGGVSFVCLYLDEDLEASAPEKMLLGKYEGKYERTAGEQPEKLQWNNNGFGNNDPGRRRDGSAVEANHFDALYPVNLDLLVNWLTPGPRTVAKVLAELKRGLPYNLRFEKDTPRARQDYNQVVQIPDQGISVRTALKLIVGTLTEGWQATALPGYLILYYESTSYDSAQCWWSRAGASVVETPGPGKFAPATEIAEKSEDGENEED